MHALDIRDFGAVGDGVTLDTAAVQKAIDAVSAQGGGTVYVGPGRYRIRTVYLRSNMTLFLDSGSALVADPHPGEGVFDRGLLVAEGCQNLRICGGGSLYGSDAAFWVPKKPEEMAYGNPIRFWAVPEKPRPHMLYFIDCEYINLESFSIEASPVYAGWIIHCHHINILGTHVRNRGDGPNTDGYHFASCSHVNIAGCSFVCGDDCIAIDSCRGGDSKHFTITGCSFDSTVNVFRIYTGIDHRQDKSYVHDVSDISASGCTANASGVFNLTAERGTISNIAMTGFTINTPPERTGNWAFLMTWDGRIRDCLFSDIVASHNGAVSLVGEPGMTIERVTFQNVRTTITPVPKTFGLRLPEPIGDNYAIHHHAPYNVDLRFCRDVVLRHFDLAWGQGGTVRDEIPALSIDRCEDVRLEDFRGEPYPGAKD